MHVLIIAPFFSFHNCTAKQLEFHKLLIRAADQLYLAGLAISIVVIILEASGKDQLPQSFMLLAEYSSLGCMAGRPFPHWL